MKRICRTCLKEFDGEKWMKQCYECYKNFKGHERINTIGDETTIGVVLLSHPDCTKEEINNYIKKRFGSVGTPENWGAVEITKTKRKVWWNCQNTD
jgi:predicted nucleotide-binding protein (sugar kinase/HSP70/actin superfamily)